MKKILNIETGLFEEVEDEPVQQVQPDNSQIMTQEKGILNIETGLFETDQEPVQPESPQQEVEKGLFDFFTGSAAIEQTPELGTLPEFGSTPEGERFDIAAGLLTTFDPQAQLDMIQEAIPEVVLTKTPDGSTIIEAPTEGGGIRRSVLNRPGASFQDATTATANILAFLPVSKLAQLANTIKGKFALGSLGAAGTEKTLQEGGTLLGRKEENPMDVLLAAGVGGIAEIIMPAINVFRKARQASKIGAEVRTVDQAVDEIRPVVEAQEAVQRETGQKVDLFRAQQTQLPSELLKQRILPQLDAGSKIAMDALEVQDKQVFDATMALVNKIAPEGVIPTASKQFRDITKKALENERATRSKIVKPLYDAAFDEAKKSGLSVDLGPVKKFVNKELKKLVEDDPAAIGLKSFLERLEGVTAKQTKPGVIVDTFGDPLVQSRVRPIPLEKLQSAKITTEAKIDKIAGENSSASARAKGLLSQANKIYVEQLGKLSPKFKAANEEFAKLSKGVDDLEESIVGQVSKVKDTNLKDIAQKIFNPKTELTDPTSVIKAKKIIDSIDPNAWDNLLRTEINRRMAGISDLVDVDGNVPAQLLRTLFGKGQNRTILLSGMNKEQKQNFKYLETLLKRASSGRAAGSPTEGFKRATEKLRGTALVMFESIFKPLQTVKEAGSTGVFSKNVEAAARAMFDPKFRPQLSKLRKMDQNAPESARAMAQLLRMAEEEDQ